MTTVAVLHWRNDAGRARAERVLQHLTGEGLRVCALGANWFCLGTDDGRALPGGFVLGTLIPPHRSGGSAVPDAGHPHDFAERLVSTSWGRYVAIHEVEGTPHVMGDPSGAWPLWQLRTPDLALVSDVITPTLARIAADRVPINEAALAAALLDPACIAHLPFLREIAPLTPGCSCDLASGKAITVWRVADHIAAEAGEPAVTLRRAVDLAVAAMTDSDMVVQVPASMTCGVAPRSR